MGRAGIREFLQGCPALLTAKTFLTSFNNNQDVMSDTTPTSQYEKLTQEQLDAMVELHNRFLTNRIGGRRATLKMADMSGLSLVGKDLRQADFTGCNMQKMNLTQANFQEAKLYACDLTGSKLVRSNFIRADLRGARIVMADLEGANLDKADLRVGGIASEGQYDAGQVVTFKGANLSGARLVGSMANNADFSDSIMTGANLTGADLRNAHLEGADLSDAQVTGAKMKGAQLKSAILTGVNLAELSPLEVDYTQAITDDNVGASIADIDEPLANKIESHRQWVASAGKNGVYLDLSHYDMRSLETLKDQVLTAIKAVGAKFFGMDLSNVQMQSAILDDADFRSCNMDKADLRGSSFKKARFNHATLKDSNFDPLMFGSEGANKRFAPSIFDQATFTYANLSGSQLRSASFKNADVSYANFSGCDLRDADFTGAILTGTIFDDAQTEGAIIPSGAVFKMKTSA